MVSPMIGIYLCFLNSNPDKALQEAMQNVAILSSSQGGLPVRYVGFYRVI